MLGDNLQYVITKRKFVYWLKEAQGYSTTTIDSYLRAIKKFEEFRKKRKSKITSNELIQFKKIFKHNNVDGKVISVQSYNTYLIHLRKFLFWLSRQNGYKQYIEQNVLDYLKINNKENMSLYNQKDYDYPDLDYVRKLVGSIPRITQIDERDRALISFTFLTGMRDQAIATLPISQVNFENHTVKQDPEVGVKTKYSKYILSYIFDLDGELIDNIRSWIEILRKNKYSPKDPLFPRTGCIKSDKQLIYEKGSSVEPHFWKTANPVRKIFKERSSLAGLKYYNPHRFRHGLVQELLRRATTAEQMKAISQHFGHAHIATTFQQYGNYSEDKLLSVLMTIPSDINNIVLNSEQIANEFRKLASKYSQIKKRGKK